MMACLKMGPQLVPWGGENAAPRASRRHRAREAIRSWWPGGAPGRILLALLALGVLLRLVAIASLWPVTNTIDDGYQLFASNPFEDAQHPAGYGLIVAGLGHLTQSVILPVLLQHLCGIASALLFFAATQRISGSPWAGLLPAGIVLLNPDLIFLEQAIMSETWAVLASAVGLYAAVRATDPGRAAWRWGLAAGVVLGLGVTMRTAGLLMIPVVVLAVFLCRPRPLRGWRRSLPAPLAMASGAAIVLLAYASANAAFGPRFGVGPSPGWYLYGRVAQFADCSQFTPPAGTGVLCDSRPPSERPGARDLLFSPEEPAQFYFAPFGNHDELLGEWASRAARAQPLDFARTAWDYLRSYYVPATLRQGLGEGLSPHSTSPSTTALCPDLRAQPGGVLRPLHLPSLPPRARLPGRLAARDQVRRRRTVDHHGARPARSADRQPPVAGRSRDLRPRRAGADRRPGARRTLRRSLHRADGGAALAAAGIVLVELRRAWARRARNGQAQSSITSLRSSRSTALTLVDPPSPRDSTAFVSSIGHFATARSTQPR